MNIFLAIYAFLLGKQFSVNLPGMQLNLIVTDLHFSRLMEWSTFFFFFPVYWLFGLDTPYCQIQT